MSASISSLSDLSESQRAALISLLADEDIGVYQTIRSRIIACGPDAVAWLKPYLLSDDPRLRRRSREIVHHFLRQETDTAFLSFCLRQGEEFDVEQGAFLLARTQYPDLNIEAYKALLDEFAAELRPRIDANAGPENILAEINEFLFEQLGFSGNEEDYYDPENSYLNRVLDRRTGNPISLSLVYIFVARRLKLPVAGIGLPGHFLARFQSARGEFYIDAFNKGKLLTKADCIKYLLQSHLSLEESYLWPVSARRVLLRICANLHQIYSQLKQQDELSRFQRYIVALAK
jgi:regulator of sirC expression with transglutaminase-like and TPR domain